MQAQRTLAAAGLYDGKVDGVNGPKNRAGANAIPKTEQLAADQANSGPADGAESPLCTRAPGPDRHPLSTADTNDHDG